ncbi:MAG: diphosphomevalonate decarboxylase [Thermoplasmata archaeon]|nr:diphosphomevalonate decarboxylase [Thermoplasmata archaeon]
MGRREPPAGSSATYTASPNIALVKYWGMRDVELGLPWNSSLSVTLAGIATTTAVRFVPGRKRDSLILNHRSVTGPPLEAVRRFLDRVRSLADLREGAEVVSNNNFPTASGLASSASGFAALAGAASAAAGLHPTSRELSRLARFGSGSASRSIFGGFVEWRAGAQPDGRDCYARRLFDEHHWPELVDLVCLLQNAPVKVIRSAGAMQGSVTTSPLFSARQSAVPERLRRMIRAIRDRDARALFPVVMEECDDFRAVCESTVPTLDYLTPVSRAVLAEVRAANSELGEPIAAYTHDAGAHVHVFTLEKHAEMLQRRLRQIGGVDQVRALRPGPGGHLVSSPAPAAP